MSTTFTELSSPAVLSWWSGIRLLRQRYPALLIGSNAVSSAGGAMQLLLHGWLAVAWGGSPLFLLLFAAARLAPKIILTVPAGVICDMIPRKRIMLAARIGYTAASLLPLVGLTGQMPMVWLFSGVILAGAIHAFDLSSSRAVFGDVIDRDDMLAAVAVNRAGSHVSSLLGPAVAFLLISRVGAGAALGVSAFLLATAALALVPLPRIHQLCGDREIKESAHGLFRYLRQTPTALILVLAGIIPAFVDKAVVLLLPSIAEGGDATMSMALMAPEAGALVAAAVLAFTPVHPGVRSLIAGALLYALFLALASTQSHQAAALVVALGFAGMASAGIGMTAHGHLQRLVPADMRGRVFAV